MKTRRLSRPPGIGTTPPTKVTIMNNKETIAPKGWSTIDDFPGKHKWAPANGRRWLQAVGPMTSDGVHEWIASMQNHGWVVRHSSGLTGTTGEATVTFHIDEPIKKTVEVLPGAAPDRIGNRHYITAVSSSIHSLRSYISKAAKSGWHIHASIVGAHGASATLVADKSTTAVVRPD